MNIKEIVTSRMAWDSVLLIVGNALIGFLYLLVHAVLGRVMTPLDYASVVSLLGLLNILSLAANAVQITMARYAAEYAEKGQHGLWIFIVRQVAWRITQIGLGSLLVWAGLSFWLCPFLAAPSVASLWALGLVAYVTLYTPVLNGTLQGSHKFGWFIGAGLTMAVGRVVLGGMAGYVGGSVTLVLLAIAISVVAALVVGYLPVGKIIRGVKLPATAPSMRSVYHYIWPVALGQCALFVLMNADLVFAPRFLSGETLAVYSKAAMLSRSILFLPLPVAIAMFPRAVNSDNWRLLAGPLLLAVGLLVFAALVLSFAPGLLLNLMYGVGGVAYSQIISLYIWAAMPLALLNVVVQYLWARDRIMVVLWLVPVAGGYVAALFLGHQSVQLIILWLFLSGFLGLVGLVAALFYRPRRA